MARRISESGENRKNTPLSTEKTEKNRKKYLAIGIFLWYYISVGIRTAPDHRPVLLTELAGEMTGLEVKN